MKTQITEKQRNLADQQYEIHRAHQQKEVDANSKLFRERLNDLFRKHPGEFALMKNGKIIDFFDNRANAIAEGKSRFDDCIFSTHKITKEVIHMPCIDFP